jgi:hypothetical protein
VARLRLSVIREFWITASARNPHGPERRTRRWLLAGGRLSAAALGAAFIVFGASVLASAQTLSWSIVPSPNRVTEDFLADVSCASATACMAVGDNGRTLAESWNGTSWSLVSSPSPGAGALSGVSCVSSAVCTAVGYVRTLSGGYRTLIESWNGTNWSVVPSPNIGSASDQNYLSGVSCTSATACTAVGYHYNGVFKTLIESWNGTSWSVVPSPSPGGVNDGLYGVSCMSATACTAVGGRLSSAYRTLIESWDGTSWSVVPSPNVGSATSPNSLQSVSCTSVTACTAVGTHYASSTSPGRTLAESWNGTSWSVVPSPNPASTGDTLSGVSCTSATTCTATGSTGGSPYQTLIESWNGTSWSVVPSPNAGSISSNLDGVSCTSATACTAVGTYYVHGSSMDLGRTLIESGTASG